MTGHWKTNPAGMERLDGRRPNPPIGNTLRVPVTRSRRLPCSARQATSGTTQSPPGFTDPQGLRRPDQHEGDRALPPHDHRPGRPRARSDVRVRDDGVCRRAVGAAVDHHRHEPRGARARPHAPHGGEVPVLPARRLARRQRRRWRRAEVRRYAPSSPMPRARTRDIRQGFVYERVQHVTLKSIANNPDINEGMTREEIDAAIKRHADSELLYDKPYEDPKRIRVHRAVHRREPVAAPRAGDRRGAPGQPRPTPSARRARCPSRR